MKCWIKISFLLAWSIILSIPVFAQYDASATLSLGMGHGQTALSQNVMSNAFTVTNSKGVTTANAADYIYLGSSHYRGFEKEIFDQVLAKDKNTDKGKLRSFLNATRTRHLFFQRARSYGLKETYISDILATGIAWNWEMYHQITPSKQKVVNLRNNIRSNMSKSSVMNEITKLSDEEKRQWILSFMYNHSMLAQTIKQTGSISTDQKQQLKNIAQQAGVPDIISVDL